jgi:hypothetical protein
MLRHALLLALCLVAGCASVPIDPLTDDSHDTRASFAPDASPAATTSEFHWNPSAAFTSLEPGPEPLAASDPLALPQYQQPPPPPPHAAKPPPRNRFTIKGGYYGSDEDDLDDGWIVNLSWMQPFSEMFAMEFEVGYLDASGSENNVDTDVWAIPTMLNGRVSLPIGPIEAYGGGGFGSMYYDGERNGTVVDVSADGWLYAWDTFVGATITTRNSISLGVEWKWYFTDESNGLDTGLDANAVMLTLGWSR